MEWPTFLTDHASAAIARELPPKGNPIERHPRPRSEPELAAMERTPSEQASGQLRFTPYPFEDVGLLCRESDPGLYLFSSDYPHAEGGRDPIRRFETSLVDHPDQVRAGFFAANAESWLG